MVDPTVGAMLVLGTTFVLGALAGQWDTKRTMKRRDRSIYEAYEMGRRDQRLRSSPQPSDGQEKK